MSHNRIAFFADVHSNLEALETCLDHARQQGAKKFVFLGDLVGYNANPKEVLHLVMQMVEQGTALAIRGNHDTACYENYSSRLKPEANLAIDWTISQLDQEHIQFLKNLPLVHQDEDKFYVHASAFQPESWHYVNDGLSAWRSAESSGKNYTFSGHVHQQSLYYQSSVGKLICFNPRPGDAVPTGKHRRWVAIAGSLGQPRDSNPKANYLIFDPEEESMYFHRVAYNHLQAADKVLSAGLPESLSKRLLQGQ